jgi:hypothetical protein
MRYALLAGLLGGGIACSVVGVLHLSLSRPPAVGSSRLVPTDNPPVALLGQPPQTRVRPDGHRMADQFQEMNRLSVSLETRRLTNQEYNAHKHPAPHAAGVNNQRLPIPVRA